MNKKFKVGLIRVLTTEDEEVLQSHGKQIMEYFPELEVLQKSVKFSRTFLLPAAVRQL